MINFLIGFLIEIKVLVLKIKIDKASHVLSRAMLSKGYSKDFNDKCKTVRKKLLAFYDKDLKQPSNYRNAEYMLDEAMVLCNKFNYLVENHLLQNIKEIVKAQDRQPQTHFLEVVEIVMVAAIAAVEEISNE